MSDKITYFGVGMVCTIAAAIATVPDFTKIKRIEDKVDQLLQGQPAIELRTGNVTGGKAPEKFYKIEGKKVFLEIDGQPVESYFQNKE